MAGDQIRSDQIRSDGEAAAGDRDETTHRPDLRARAWGGLGQGA